eukprot:TRINITY_DN4268_c0_g1_i1.p1 TRINITY_DN4268_c0_g1~~TRINITY_DN4268_c0_g1_i1.p1  ORF type:complete len:324 (-),score=70.04 TRINITY_DN4268_c0_g1_i1:32-1003(-)
MSPTKPYSMFEQEAEELLNTRPVRGIRLNSLHRISSLFTTVEGAVGLSSLHGVSQKGIFSRNLFFSLGISRNKDAKDIVSRLSDIHRHQSIHRVPRNATFNVLVESTKKSIFLDAQWGVTEHLGIQAVCQVPSQIRATNAILNTHYEYGRWTLQSSACSQQQFFLSNMSVSISPNLTIGGEFAFSFLEKLASLSTGLRYAISSPGSSTPSKILSVTAGAFGNLQSSYFQYITSDRSLAFCTQYRFHLYSLESDLALGIHWKPSERWSFRWWTDTLYGFATAVAVNLPASVAGYANPFSSLEFHVSTDPTNPKRVSYGFQVSHD